jgi:prolyl-tRNA synthetase
MDSLSVHARAMLSIIDPQASFAHPDVSSPATWRTALEAANDAPTNFELIKVLVFKPKTAKSATPVPVVVIAREETETSAAALGKKIGQKEMRLASEDLLQEFFQLDKNSRECSVLVCRGGRMRRSCGMARVSNIVYAVVSASAWIATRAGSG